MNDVVIVGAARTPIAKFLGSFKDLSAVDLGIIAVRGALDKAGISPTQVNDVVGGMIFTAGAKPNPARQVQLGVGIPLEAGATTLDQQCGSGMRAIDIATQSLQLDKAGVSVAFGAESMSRVPYLLLNVRQGLRLGTEQIHDAMLHDALIDPFTGTHMGITAEALATKYQISREEQDELAIESHKRACAAIAAGKFAEEIVPVSISLKKGTVTINTDEQPRADISIEQLRALRPSFQENGTVTAGNASSINDGAAALVLTTARKAKELGVRPLARILATATYGVAPEIMGVGPVFAIPKALKSAGLSISDINYFEINEAFAAQYLAVNRELKLNPLIVNANGSGIGLGHPVGCTGARIVVSLLHELRRRKGKYGVASLCVGGGPSMAMVIETV